MKSKAGFTLIEVLVAMFILGVGLLGLAALQANGLKNNQSAYNRSQATQLAYDMADRIRANPVEGYNRAYGENNANTLANSGYAKICGLTNNPACTTTSTLAKNDIANWQASISAALPNKNALGNIVVDAPSRVFTITISWSDNLDEDVNLNGTLDTGEDKNGNGKLDISTFAMSFQI